MSGSVPESPGRFSHVLPGSSPVTAPVGELKTAKQNKNVVCCRYRLSKYLFPYTFHSCHILILLGDEGEESVD